VRLYRPIDLQLEAGSWQYRRNAPIVSARHSVPPSEHQGGSDICQPERLEMMGESFKARA